MQINSDRLSRRVCQQLDHNSSCWQRGFIRPGSNPLEIQRHRNLGLSRVPSARNQIRAAWIICRANVGAWVSEVWMVQRVTVIQTEIELRLLTQSLLPDREVLL